MTWTVTREAKGLVSRYLKTILLFIQTHYVCGHWITWTPLIAHY